ncbi:MAG TPA: TolC family protein [Terriglobales bacterium]|nr:TolC family protein [Terriglobales bacterium]
MHHSRLTSAARQLLALALAAILPCLSWGQQQNDQQPSRQEQTAPVAQSQPAATVPVETPQPRRFQLQDYSKPKGYFPNPVAPYTPRSVPPPDLANTPRIEQLLQNGKLMLSMNDAVALALENNMDIAIQRYNVAIADTDIMRAKAGSTILGINSGVVQNTPGGTTGGLGGSVGSGPGGTSAGSAGAAAGLGGIVSTTLGQGSPITSFDPILTGTLQMDRNYTQSSSVFSPIPISNQNTGIANFAYTQGFHWGTNMSLGFSNTHTTSDNPTNTYTPFINSNFQFRLTQHLLQGFGFAPNTRFIRIAKNDREISDVAFRLQTITTVDQIENMYWDLVFAYENVRVAQENIAFAKKTLSDTQKQVQIGTLAPIEVVRAQSTVATDQQQLTLAQTNLELQQLLMKNALSRTLVDPRLADAEVIPTSTMQLPTNEPVIPTQDLVNDALSHRPELAEARIGLTNTEISNKAIRNSMRPALDLYGYYGGAGIGGDLSPNVPVCTPQDIAQGGGFNFCFDPARAAKPFRNGGPVSYGHTLSQLVDSSSPDKGVGVTLTIPIRNRAAQALQVRGELEYRQAQMRLQQIENQVRIEVRNAQFAVQQNRASVEAAQAAVELARQSLDAEQKKYALGASTSTLVLQNQTALAQAESTLVSASAAYEKSRVELDRATGLLLDHAGILVADAEKGEVTHMPNIPFVTPRANPSSVMPSAPQDQSPQPPEPQQPQGQPEQHQAPQTPPAAN